MEREKQCLRNKVTAGGRWEERNSACETKLLLAGDGKRETVPAKQKFTNCVLVGDSVQRNVGAEHADMMVECFLGISPYLDKRGEYGELLIMPADGRWDLTRRLKG